VIALVGTGGGVGTTTVAAHIAAALQAQQRRSLAFDFCANNTLRLHFGMDWEDGTGLAPQVLTGAPWNEAAYRSARGIDFVPFGRLDHGLVPGEFWAFLRKRPQWFAERLAELREESATVVVCDCPQGEGSWRDQILPHANLVVVVLGPDAVSYAQAAETVHRLAADGARDVALLLNGFDATRTLDRDIAVLLRHDFQRTLIPVVIHRDESLREALASRQTVFDYAPTSRAALDFTSLAGWVAVRAGRQARAA
jgi:cellulose synthase operon protein YhjQ